MGDERVLIRCLHHHPQPDNPRGTCATPLAAVTLAAGSEAAIRCRRCGGFTAVYALGYGGLHIPPLRCPSKDCRGTVSASPERRPHLTTCPACGLEFMVQVIDLMANRRDSHSSVV